MSSNAFRKRMAGFVCLLLLSSFFSVSVLAEEEFIEDEYFEYPDAGAEPTPDEGFVYPESYMEPDAAETPPPEGSMGIMAAESSVAGGYAPLSGGGGVAPYEPETVVAPESPISLDGAFQSGLFTGSASYSIPFKVSPGTAGFAPSVSLSYSSGSAKGKAGLYGLGWSLSESYILRDVNYTPDDSSDDEFDLILNGQKHDLVYSEELWGGVASRYKTKIDTYMHIYRERLGLTCGGVNEFCEVWFVRTRDGTTFVFGYSRDSELNSTNRDYVVRWSLDEIRDTHGNTIFYNYNESDGTAYPSSIEYNGGRKRVVSFEWEPRPDVYTSYQGGTFATVSRRLSGVRVEADNNLVRKYVLSYELNSAGTKSILSTIQECGTDETTCLPATEFIYNLPLSDGSWADSGWSLPERSQPDILSSDSRVVDVNGDGLADILKGYLMYGQPQTWAYINDGSGWVETDAWDPPTYFYGGCDLINPSEGGVLGEVNGDGLPDIITGIGTDSVWLNTGSGWVLEGGWTKPPFNPCSKYGVYVLDVDGDGRDDIVRGYSQDTSHGYYNFREVWLNRDKSWVLSPDWVIPHVLVHYSWTGGFQLDSDSRFSDVNGDGLVDILVTKAIDGPIGVFLNNGSGWFHDPSVSIPVNFTLESGVRLADVNGDGLVDILKGIDAPWGDTFTAYLGTGSGWVENDSFAPPTPFYYYLNYDNKGSTASAFGDVDGDGSADILRKASQVEGIWFNRFHRDPGRFALREVRNPLGGVVSIDYVSSSSFDNTGGDGVSDLRSPMAVVSSVSSDNGLSGEHGISSTTSFQYSGGLFDFVDREFRGFNRVDEVYPENKRVGHRFHQDDARKGREYLSKVGDSGVGRYFRWVESSWSFNESGGVFEVFLDSVAEKTYDGGIGYLMTQTLFDYDGYGNVVKATYLGDVSVSGDEKFEFTDFYPNTNAWVLNRPARRVLTPWDNVNMPFKVSYFYYDGASDWNTPPTRGDLTRQVGWSNSGTDAVSEYSYDSFGNAVSSTDANGYTTYYSYDSTRTYLLLETNPLGHVSSFSYDFGSGNLLQAVDSNGFSTNYSYDELGRADHVVRPYDSADYPTTNYTYFVNGSAPSSVLVGSREAAGELGTFDVFSFVDGFGRVVQSRSDAEDSSKQVVSDTFYDTLGRVASRSVPYLQSYSTSYSTPAGSRFSLFGYDVLDRVVSVTNPDGSERALSYYHWVSNVSDENSHLKSYISDAFGRIVEVKEFNNGGVYSTSYVYNILDQIYSITDDKGNVFTFVHDTLGRLTGLDDPDLGVWTYGYDGVGNLLQQTDARGVVTAFIYDGLNRVTKVDYPSDQDVLFAYDSPMKGTLSSVAGGFGDVSYSYDMRLRKTGESWNSGGNSWTKSFSYDSLDRVVGVVEPNDDVVDYGYNNQNLLDSVSGVASFDYDALGKPTNKSFANGVSTSLHYYENNSRLKQISTPSMQALSYSYDLAGNVKSIQEAVEGTSEVYNYDDLDRLSSAVGTGSGYSVSLGYDSIGNILNVTSDGNIVSYTYGTGNSPGPHAVVNISGDGGGSGVNCSGSFPPWVGDWLVTNPTVCYVSEVVLSLGSNLFVRDGSTLELSDSNVSLNGRVSLDGTLRLSGNSGFKFKDGGGLSTEGEVSQTQTLSYDSNGNLVEGFGFTYEYNDANRLRKVREGGDVVEEYTYDFDGNRFMKVSGDSTTYYVGKDYQTVVNSSGEFNTIHYRANGELVGRRDHDGSMYFYHNDHLGGTHVVTDFYGNEIPGERTRYYPFGKIKKGGVSEHLYTGQRWDQGTGQYYYHSRYYNPQLRRFTQPDTIIPDYYNPQALNRYSYTYNNPQRYVDPNGHEGVSWEFQVNDFFLLGLQGTLKNSEGKPYSGVLMWDSETSSIEVGYFNSKGVGAGTPEASLSGKVTYYDKNYDSISDLEGVDLSSEFSVSFLFLSSLGGVSNPVEDEGKIDQNQRSFSFGFAVDSLLLPFDIGGSTSLTSTEATSEGSVPAKDVLLYACRKPINFLKKIVENEED